MYYTETAKDTIVLGGMNVDEIKTRPDDKDDCFVVNCIYINFWFKLFSISLKYTNLFI